MPRKERQQKFHDSLLNMLYAHPPSPPYQKEVDEEALNIALEACNADHIHDEFGRERSSSSSSDGDSDLGHQKLTRAQRKRLRKKKLKEAASQRRKIIGPQLPTTSTSDDQLNGEERDVIEYQPEDVRHNGRKEPESGIDQKQGKTNRATMPDDSCTKLKQRRMSKKQARERSKPSTTDCCHEGQSPCGKNEGFPMS